MFPIFYSYCLWSGGAFILISQRWKWSITTEVESAVVNFWFVSENKKEDADIYDS